MAQYATQADQQQAVEPVGSRSSIANPQPLGMGALAFTTAIIGCSYAGFLIPALPSGVGVVVAAAFFYGGIVQILAGMWAFRRGNTIPATIFSSYGGFLAAFATLFMPGFGIAGALAHSAMLDAAAGLFFLCWTIFTGILFLGSLKSNIALLVTLLLMFVAYLFLTIGQLAGANNVLFAIGGWVAIATAVVGWYTALAHMINSSNSLVKLPLGWID